MLEIVLLQGNRAGLCLLHYTWWCQLASIGACSPFSTSLTPAARTDTSHALADCCNRSWLFGIKISTSDDPLKLHKLGASSRKDATTTMRLGFT
jgi:hypothetical protein